MRLKAGDQAPRLRMTDVEGNVVMLGAGKRRRLVCFFGDAACALCNAHIHELLEHHERLARRGLDVVVLYGATQESVWRFVSGRPRPFAVIADSTSVAARAYHVERSFWGKLKGVTTRTSTFLQGLKMVGATGLNANTVMPADFLIDEYGTIVEAHYGRDAGDHIPFERVEAFAEQASISSRWESGLKAVAH